MANVFFPYEYRGNSITHKITELRIDGQLRTNLIQPETTSIDLTAITNWSTAEIAVEVVITDDMPKSVLPKSEQDDPPWRVIVTATSLMQGTRQIGWRQSKELTPDGATKLLWNGRMQFERNDVGSTIRLRSYVTRSGLPGLPVKGFADEPGMRMGAGEDWVIQIDQKSIPPGKSMKIEWVKFQTSENANLKSNASCLHYLDLEHEVPTLYLNEDIQDLKTVLMSGGYVGPKAAIRDALFTSIAQPVWLTLAFTTATKTVESEDERPEWEQAVLEQIAPCVYPEENDDEAVRKLAAEGQDAAARLVLLERLIPAVQKYLDIKKSTTRLFQHALQGA